MDFKKICTLYFSLFNRLGKDRGNPFSTVMDLVFPPLCLVGGELLKSDEKHICEACISKIDLIRSPLCILCGRPFFTPNDKDHFCGGCITKKPPFDSARALGAYGGVLLDAIHLFKYHHRAYLFPTLSSLMAEWEYSGLDLDNFDYKKFDMLIPVPLHIRRLYERGYNQALLLCRGLEKSWGIPVNYKDLIRSRWTEPQVKLSPKERIKNVKGAFEVRKRSIDDGIFEGKRVLVVDDVYTTGATVSECSRVLKGTGAKYVGVLTLARVVIK